MDTTVGWERERKKNYDDSSSDSFSFLATLKKPMDVISEYHVVLVNPHTFFRLFLSFRDYFRSHSFACLPFRHDSGMPPQSQKKKCHTTDSSLMIYTYAYICIYIHVCTRWQTLSIKNTLRVLFLFFVSHVVVHRESGMKIGETSERERQRVCVTERKKLNICTDKEVKCKEI